MEDPIRDNLVQRAEKILTERRINPQELDRDVFQLINDLNLYQIELEIQNDDLLNTQIELEESRNKYIDLFEYAPTGYFTLSQHGIILDVNEAGVGLLNVKRHSLLNNGFSRYVASEFQKIFHACRLNSLKDNNLHKCEIKLLRKNGTMFFAQLNCKAVLNQNTKVLLVFITDISDRKRSEILLNEINRIDKTSFIDKLLSMITHELNQPLCIIDNYLQGCINRLESGDFDANEIIVALKNATKQTKRASEIILRSKNFSTHRVVKKECIDLNDLIDESIKLMKYETHELNLTILYSPNKNLPALSVDKTHIVQVLLNLGRNAIESLRDHQVQDPRIRIEVNVLNINLVEICVIDNGPGVDPEISKKIFLPNFTTKSYGIGLGLTICDTLIEANSGKISYEKYPSGGACFKFTLPVDLNEVSD